jgi:hypothetical protein
VQHGEYTPSWHNFSSGKSVFVGLGRVEKRRGGDRRRGIAVADGFRQLSVPHSTP